MAKKPTTKTRTAKKSPAAKAAKKQIPLKKTRTKATTQKKKHGTCLVLMPFSDPFDLYFDQLYKPAIEKANLETKRADDLFRPSPIVSDLWDMIQNSKVLFAELTTKNANVFYELGLAHAIGKPVVLISETMDDVPFDLQQLRVLNYDKDDPKWGDKLANDITSALKEAIDEPIKSVPHIFRKLVESQAPEQDILVSRMDELESQVRRLRLTKKQPLSTRSRASPAHELHDVSSPEEFDKWVMRWHDRGVPREVLENVVRNSEGVPEGEVDRIRGIILNHRFS